MKYLIANRVIYDSESGELVVKEPGNEQSKRLTNTANRILSLLIASPGRVLERDYLLDKVWEEAGHPGSSSSLSQYISILRKTLTSLIFIEEIIVAVPKVGFYFSPEIAVELQNDEEMVSTTPLPVSLRKAATKDKKNLWLIAAIAFLLLANLWILSQKQGSPRFAAEYRIGEIGNCKFTAYEDLSEEVDPQVMNIIRQLQPELELKCARKPAQIMVYFQPSVLYGSHGRFFYSYCPTDKATAKIVYCENYYAFNWKLK
ncbi:MULTISPECIES: transcriptional regulator [Citrobacter]|jgi:DNA-binding winged helix-turn-helix (wHTH) protein|uniref:winged helix-turn-helix domain-containing protein n=1 Tax=Citrobacter TaxID=544 RepID=UPI00103B3D6E|nr:MULTISPECIES: winged helix-turn-helix domain-containing protein [Citrobacter]MBA8086270.1 winged helix-turn-helix domain-containing protein [Citrobacter sp. RHBSTW-00089]MBD9978894.1 transcriptional regulator [Citrobacter braakii]MBJ9262314.1 winged helix-turn-helix domain-containing protein [Citrobacter braakii]MBN4809397.1 winged helix-turn-helix domain-containing protein [Citrobacter braakii]MBN4814395.1 winged helix-turn-helix domain-containing protein [Citrobacter braakii]